MPCIALTSSINLHLLYAVTCMLSCQQISCENPGLISNTSWLLYFWTKGEWILSITGINISPAMLSLFMTQDTNTIPVPWIQRNHLPTRAWSLVSRGKKPPGRARLQTSMRMGKESLSRKYSSVTKTTQCPGVNISTHAKINCHGIQHNSNWSPHYSLLPSEG